MAKIAYVDKTFTAAHEDVIGHANKIIAENCKPGNPSTEWDINGWGDPTIQGFATDISYNLGQTAEFKDLIQVIK